MNQLNSKIRIGYSIILAVIVLSSCDGNWKHTLNEMTSEMRYGNNADGWFLSQHLEYGTQSEFIIKKIDGDTLKALFFRREENGNVLVDMYKENFVCGPGPDTCVLQFDYGDTTFFYRVRDGSRTFIVGEYAYRYEYGRMDSSERVYYELHEDSLKRVRGNRLPMLTK